MRSARSLGPPLKNEREREKNRGWEREYSDWSILVIIGNELPFRIPILLNQRTD